MKVHAAAFHRRFDSPALLVPRKPARQSAAIGYLCGDALNGRFLTTLHCASVRSHHSRPAPFRSGFQKRPFSAKDANWQKFVIGFSRHPSFSLPICYSEMSARRRATEPRRIGLAAHCYTGERKQHVGPLISCSHHGARFATEIIPAKEDTARIGPWRDSELRKASL